MPIKPVKTVLSTEDAIAKVCDRAQQRIFAKVLEHYHRHPGNAWSGKYLVDLEKTVKALYRQLGIDIGEQFREGLPQTMREFYDRAAAQLKTAGVRNNLLGAPDTGRVNYFLNSSYEQIAMRTTRMSFDHIKQLRTISAEVLRTASMTGETRQQVTKQLLERAMEIPGFKFTDNGGRVWKDEAYFKMLARTELMNAGRAAYDDKCAAEGCDVMMLDYSGNCCEACAKWEGQLFSLTGATPGLPTKADLEAEGVFHPNCTHSYSAVPDYVAREDFDKEGKPKERPQPEPEPQQPAQETKPQASQPAAAAPHVETAEEHRQRRQEQLERAKDARLQRECALVAPDCKPIKGPHSRDRDLEMTNPNFDKAKINIWSVNCQRCITAYEARRRGLDVVAKPAPPLTRVDALSADRAWRNAYKGGQMIDCCASNGLASQKKIIKAMDEMPDGARCAVQVIWKGRNSGGHVFIAEKAGGKVTFVDPQQSGQEVQRDYGRCFANANGKLCYIMRIDNLKFSDTVSECCTARKK